MAESGLEARQVDDRLWDCGYPAPVGQWLRIMNSAVITRHMINALTSVFGCQRAELISEDAYYLLDLCRNPRCEH